MRVLLMILAAIAWAGVATAQRAGGPSGGRDDAADLSTATLIADRLTLAADERLIAEGNVEVYFEGKRLTSPRLVYDQTTEILIVEGPIVLTEGPEQVILADQAEIDDRLERGILRSARLVIDRQLQLAADELTRVSGRYTRLSRATASSCEICEGSSTPLWEIRSNRVIRDETARQLYFENATLRVASVPVFYIPRLRIPDPSLRRATGFLVPRFRNRSRLSTGIKLPYFIRMGDHADLTLTPYISPATNTLEFLFRRQFASGRLTFEGAVSRDDILPDDIRAYLFARGQFRLRNDFQLAFDLEFASDRAYLTDYGYSGKDRLDSAISLSRVRDGQTIRAEATLFETLRARELSIEQELPNEILEFGFRQRLAQDPALGSLWAMFDAAVLERDSSEPGRGRDLARLGAGLDWSANRTLAFGVVAEADANLALDLYGVNEDPAFDDQLTRVRGGASLTLRWPLERIGAGGARHLVEPVVQLGWADVSGDAVPNEDSLIVEFDEGNLLSLSRFPGVDRFEQGARLNLGLSWTRFDPDGWSLGATVGRIFRDEDLAQFGSGTGLSGTSSDWLLAAQLRYGSNVTVTSRSLLDDTLNVSRSETRFRVAVPRASVTGTHLWRSADPTENRNRDLSELSLGGTFNINPMWQASSNWRFDAEDGETTRAQVGLKYANECIEVALSLSRRFTKSSIVQPATEFDLRVAFTGLGTGGDRRAARRKCTG